MKIVLETIPHDQQRYPTCGDWFYEDGVLHIKVSELSEPTREWLIAVHELIEVLSCQREGVTPDAVDKFDMAFEKNQTKGDHSEPGDESDAPYRKQHCLATGIERLLAAEWGVDWKKYEEELNAL